ncbi:J domain-containing protein [Hymenobacter sp. BRD67]|uniref:J domain-containing protein n=1 Tax=Hymenobacter sp. BRD67 TaxID=2675877 RepID=UPI0015654E55|nr:J domain-containing protein [Hymenobacter sp. BRD67]QKG52269.1 J domain-containing protein [Hymenobacter sp. BRD67]
MAKKPAAPKPQLVHIPTTSADNPALSKAQKEFNRLTKRISKLEKDVAEFREAATRLRQRVQNEYRPLQARHNEVRADLVRMLDRAHDTYKLTKGERTKIVSLLLDGCYDLLQKGHPDLQPIFDKYEEPETPEEAAAADAQTAEMMKQLFSRQFGIEFDADADVSTPEKFQAYLHQKMATEQAAYEQQEAERAERRASRKKSPRQQAAEEKKQAEEQNITQAVRTLYRDLVKALHPDLEPDETEKARKTELMKQVTTAYEANELLTLLRLQLELQRIDQTHLENLAEDQLRYYNKLLKEQARELDEAMFREQEILSGFTGKPYYYTPTPAAMDYDYARQKAQLEQKIRQLAAEVLAFEHDPAALKAFLKTYKVPKAGPGPVFLEF